MSGNPLFKLLSSLNDKHHYYGDDADAMTNYSAWVINRGMSIFPETIMYSNDLNLTQGLSDRMQYDYYFHSVRKGKRFSKWPQKIERSEDHNLIKEYYKYNDKRTEEALTILTKDQIEAIRTINEKGGFKNESGRKPRGGKTK